MCRMAPLLGGDLSRRVFLDRFASLCSDGLFHVRKICAANFGEFSAVVGQEITESVLVNMKKEEIFTRKDSLLPVWQRPLAPTPAKSVWSGQSDFLALRPLSFLTGACSWPMLNLCLSLFLACLVGEVLRFVPRRAVGSQKSLRRSVHEPFASRFGDEATPRFGHSLCQLAARRNALGAHGRLSSSRPVHFHVFTMRRRDGCQRPIGPGSGRIV